MKDLSVKDQSAPEVLELERVFKAPPERVFDAFASAAALKQWFGPGYCGVLKADLDFREGGDYRMRLNTEHSGEVDLVGTYKVIDRPSQITFTWRWEDNPKFNPCDSIVEISLADHPDGTLLKLRQSGIADEVDRANHGFGWNGSFDKLEKQFS